MKSLAIHTSVRVSRSVLFAAVCSAAVLLHTAHSQTWDAQTAGPVWASGNWTTPANWSGDAIPLDNGTADVIFDLNGATGGITSGIDAATWSIDSLSLVGRTTGTNSDVTLVAGPLSGGLPQANQAANLTIGAGGISNTTSLDATGNRFYLGSLTASNVLTLTLGANQVWNNTRVSGDTNNSGRFDVSANLAGSGNLTKTGNGQLRFTGGNSTAYTGTVTLKGGGILLSAATQLGRLGPNALQWQNDTQTGLGFQLSASSHLDFAQDIVFTQTGTTSTYFGFEMPTGSPGAGANSSLTISGDMSGQLGATLLFSHASTSTKSGTFYRVTGDNSSLTTTRNAAWGYGFDITGANIRTGHVVLDSANALGTGNNFSISVGQHNGNTAGDNAGLYATNGNNVSGNIFAVINTRAGALSGETTVGLHGSGAVTFSGNLGLGSADNAGYRINPVFLSTGDGGTVTFSGQIVDQYSNSIYKAPVIATGGGTVILSNSNNTYGGTNTGAGFSGTNVTSGTTLLVNGGELDATSSGTGTGRVLVGYSAGSVGVTTTLSSSVVAVTGGTSGLIIGQTISGTGIAADSIIVNIVDANNIQLNKVATASGSATASLIAATGTLGGEGRIRPGSANGITVASGSSIAPGDSNAIGALTIALDNTTGIVTMNTGSGFKFQLAGAGADIDNVGTSDLLTLTGASNGDFVFNLNTVDFLGTGAVGYYKLFDTNFDDTTWSGLTFDPTTGFVSLGLSGANLTLGSMSAQFIVGGFSSGGDSGDIYLQVIPEPGTVALLGLAGIFLAFSRRRRPNTLV